MQLKRIIAASTAVLLLSGVSAYLIYNMQTSDTHNSDEYISITVNYETSYDETRDYAEYGVSIYEYDLQSAEVTEVFSFPQNSGYALGVYDKKTNSVYYTKEKNNNTYKRQRTGDQIYICHLDTGTDIMLTEDLLAVNYIVPVDDSVFFVGARQNNADSLALGKINITDGIIEYWKESDTLSVETISAYSDLSGQVFRKYPDSVPKVSGQCSGGMRTPAI
jgi:uncharacterized protein YxeA